MTTPLKDQIARSLRQQISDGTLNPGSSLPAETELARDHGVSRQTARAALEMLEHEGLVVAHPRRERVVRARRRLRWRLSEFESPEHTTSATLDAWEADVASQGSTPTEQAIRVEIVTPTADIAARLDLDPESDLCVARRRVRYIDNEPALISDSYFDEAIVRDTELAQPRNTTREDILAEAGYPQTYDVDEIITRMPTQEEAERLALPAGTPVAEHVRTGFTAGDKAVRVMVSIIPGDKLILQYKVAT